MVVVVVVVILVVVGWKREGGCAFGGRYLVEECVGWVKVGSGCLGVARVG